MAIDYSKVSFVDVDVNSEGQRLDNFLFKNLKGVPKSRVYRILRKGEVRVNKGRAKPTLKLQVGDQIRIPPIRVREAAEVAPVSESLSTLLASSVLYEDKDLLVVNKPSGLAVHGGSGLSVGLIESLRQIRPQDKALELVHRLDRGTSGCLILARNRRTLKHVQDQMRNRVIKKTYLALADGQWPKTVKMVDAPLLKNTLSSGERVVRVDREGKQALTYFSVEKRYDIATLLRIDLGTGRTHQIRVHTQLTGHPLAGDDKYGDKAVDKRYRQHGLHRMFLHAAALEFTHPVTGENLKIEAPLPQDLQSVLVSLEQNAEVQNAAKNK